MTSNPAITLVWPPSSLSGHANGNRWGKSAVVKKHRAWARVATLEAGAIAVPEDGDIPLLITFVPPDNRGDRTNYANRMKPAIDGIADALGVNDKRFLPTYAYAPPEKPGRVEVVIG